MAWKKVPLELTQLLDEALKSYPAQKRIMFGGPAWFTKEGNMFAAAHQDSVILRLSASDREALFAKHDEAAPFEPMAGRPMREYVTLPESLYARPILLKDWLDRSFRFAVSLPKKEKKPKSKGSQHGKA